MLATKTANEVLPVFFLKFTLAAKKKIYHVGSENVKFSCVPFFVKVTDVKNLVFNNNFYGFSKSHKCDGDKRSASNTSMPINVGYWVLEK